MIEDGDGHAEVVNSHDYTTLSHYCTDTIAPCRLYNIFRTGPL
jgi:hypothetical protein